MECHKGFWTLLPLRCGGVFEVDFNHCWGVVVSFLGSMFFWRRVQCEHFNSILGITLVTTMVETTVATFTRSCQLQWHGRPRKIWHFTWRRSGVCLRKPFGKDVVDKQDPFWVEGAKHGPLRIFSLKEPKKLLSQTRAYTPLGIALLWGDENCYQVYFSLV